MCIGLTIQCLYIYILMLTYIMYTCITTCCLACAPRSYRASRHAQNAYRLLQTNIVKHNIKESLRSKAEAKTLEIHDFYQKS